MNLIFAKLYEEYLRKDEPAKFKITLYISVVYFFLIFALVLPLKVYVEKKVYVDPIQYEKSTIMTTVFGILALITCFVYYIYIKNKFIETLTKRYKKINLNKTLLYLIVIVTPVGLLLIGGFITVYLNGGKILGNRIHGILE